MRQDSGIYKGAVINGKGGPGAHLSNTRMVAVWGYDQLVREMSGSSVKLSKSDFPLPMLADDTVRTDWEPQFVTHLSLVT